MAQVAFVIDIPNRKAAVLPNFLTEGEDIARQVKQDIGDDSTRLVNVAIADLAIVPVPSVAPVTPHLSKTQARTLSPTRVSIVGGAAGNLTVTGIRTTHTLIAVLKNVDANDAFTDLTSEFTITASDTINNTGGTTTASSHVFVVYA
jgi:hypothetical protein